MAENKWTTVITCHRHPNADLVEDYHAGDMICPECGLVVGDRCVMSCKLVQLIRLRPCGSWANQLCAQHELCHVDSLCAVLQGS